MKNSMFRSVEFWKSAIMILPDSSFFELLRSVFGRIKTPFNKQILLDDLEAFLLREDIQKNLASYITNDDARIIAAIAALDEPAPGDITAFFSGELSYAELQDRITNLEERFIVYRFREKRDSRLALNPLLESVLSPFTADASLLFPSLPEEAPEADISANAGSQGPEINAPGFLPLNDRILAGLFSFASGGESFFRIEGAIRKKIMDAGNRIFPGLDLEWVTGGLRMLGLFRVEEDRIIPDYRKFSEFGKLSSRERMEYCAAGMYCFRDNPPDISPFMIRVDIKNMAGFIHLFLGSFEPERLYPLQTLKRLADIIRRDVSGNGTMHEGAAGGKKINHSLLMDALEKAGLLFPVSAEFRRLSFPALNAAEEETTVKKNQMISMDTVFSCLVYPETSYLDTLALASVLDIREAGLTIRFEMTRDSAIRAFDRDISADIIIDLLKRLSDNTINETLIWSLKDWEKRYGEVSFRQGLVLSLSPERRYLAETMPLARLITETLVPGIYLLPETARDEAAFALQKAGVDIIAWRGKDVPVFDNTNSQALTHDSLPSLGSGETQNRLYNFHAALPLREHSADAENGAAASTLISDFHSILERMEMGKAERDELSARINRRLVLCESQLRDASVRYEKLEARGLDYAGKAIIAKQAIALQTPVELVRSGKGALRVFGIPKAIEKKGGENYLVIDPLTGTECLTDEERQTGTERQTGAERQSDAGMLRIPLGKISLLRRIKKSIFENPS